MRFSLKSYNSTICQMVLQSYSLSGNKCDCFLRTVIENTILVRYILQVVFLLMQVYASSKKYIKQPHIELISKFKFWQSRFVFFNSS
jgi:hypothetical protein